MLVEVVHGKYDGDFVNTSPSFPGSIWYLHKQIGSDEVEAVALSRYPATVHSSHYILMSMVTGLELRPLLEFHDEEAMT